MKNDILKDAGLTQENIERALEFYRNSPDGQYDYDVIVPLLKVLVKAFKQGATKDFKCKEWWISPGHRGDYDQIHTLKFNHSFRVIEPPDYAELFRYLFDGHTPDDKIWLGTGPVMDRLKRVGMTRNKALGE